MRPIIVIGAGGFGRECLDVLEAINRAEARFEILGVIDAMPSRENLARLQRRAIPFLGVDEQLILDAGADYVIGVGAPTTRAAIAARLEHRGAHAATIVHPAAVVGSASRLAEGTVVCAGAQLSTNVETARHVHINPNATIGHDARLEEFVSVNPGAIISGEVVVRSHSLIGAGAVVLQGLTVGSASTVGAAACVVRDVPQGSTVKGVPAR